MLNNTNDISTQDYLIIVAEDDDGLNNLIQRKLIRAGYKTIGVKNGFEVIEQLKKNTYSVLLLDYQLPDANGEELINTLKLQGYTVPFIVMTGYGDEKIAVQMMKLGARDYLVKGSDFIELVPKTVGNLIHALNTERKLKIAEEKLIESEARYRFISEKINDVVWMMNLEGKITYISPSVERVRGYTPEEVMKQPIEESLTSESLKVIKEVLSKNLEKIRNGIRDENPQVCELEVICKNGSTLWTEVVFNALFDDDGKFKCFLGVSRDISERKRAEREIIKAKEEAELANKAKSEFLANMSHEIRTPLNGIMGMVSVLNNTKLTDEQRYFLHMIQFSADNLYGIVQDLLDFSRIDAGKLIIQNDYFNLKDLVVKTVDNMKQLATQKGLTINYFISSKCENYYGDKVRIGQILVNLLSNAIKYTDSGSVEIIVEQSDKLILTVSDTGIGIPSDKLNTIFEPFRQLENPYTKSHQGIGLGLSIVKQLVELMNGKIYVKSEVKKGSTFVVELPILKKVVEYEKQGESKKMDETRILKGKRILLVEDEAINRLYVKMILNDKGFLVDEVSDGESALDIIRKVEYDVILMDIGLPKMNGLEATVKIRNNESERNKNVPIIALTAHAYPEDIEKCRNAGMDDYISKPIDEYKLFDSIKRLLKE